MAIYRFEAKIISRSQGRTATASAAYRAAERLEDARTGSVYDYTRKGGVLHKEILAPPETPDWMRDRAQLWNSVRTGDIAGGSTRSENYYERFRRNLADRDYGY